MRERFPLHPRNQPAVLRDRPVLEVRKHMQGQTLNRPLLIGGGGMRSEDERHSWESDVSHGTNVLG